MMRKSIKSMLPGPVDLAQKRIRAALHRLGLWRGLLADCVGVDSADQAVLWRSFWAALPTLMADAGEWREPRLIADATVSVREGFRFFIRRQSDDLGHIRQRTHQALMGPLLDHLPQGGLALDAGANIGVFTANFSRAVGPSGRVIAVEMMPDTLNSLHLTVSLNDLQNVEVVGKALSDTRDADLLVAMPDGEHFGQASIIRHRECAVRTVSVPSTTLDEVTSGLEHVHVLKMDLEGAELMALKGAGRTLRMTDAILYESSADDCAVGSLLNEVGFRVRRLDGLNMIAERSI